MYVFDLHLRGARKAQQHISICALVVAFLMFLPVRECLAIIPTPATASVTYNNRGAWSPSGAYQVNDLVTYGGNTFVNILATAPTASTTTTGGNLFDKSTIADGVVIISGTGKTWPVGGFQSSGLVNVGGGSSFVTNITISVFELYGLAFYDSNQNYVSGSSLNGNGYYLAGTPIPVPAGAQYVRFWWQNSNMGTSLDGAIVNNGTVLQQAYTSYGVGATSTTTTTPCAAPTDTAHWATYTAPPSASGSSSNSSPGPWAGKKMFLLGDSIVWANPQAASLIANNIGATMSSQGATAPGVDGFPGRTFDGFQNGMNSVGVPIPVSASVLADVDLMLIALGTNQDSALGLGTPGDAPDFSGSMSAQMRIMLETIMSWKPGMRIVVIGPYQSNRYNSPAGIDGLLAQPPVGIANAASVTVLKNINAAMKAVCNLYSIPYVDMYNESGVNFSTSALWLQDGLHPNGLGLSTFYVPYISAQLSRFIQ